MHQEADKVLALL